MLRVKRKDVCVVPIFDPPKTHAINNAFTGRSEGLIIPDIAKERCDQGVVKYIGTEVQDVKYGDHVMFAAYDGTLAELVGEGIFIILPEDKIVAVIEPPETQISGLYFRSPPNVEEMFALKEEIKSLIFEIDKMASPVRVDMMAQQILAAGFIKEMYFPCTYEMSVQLIADAITNSDWKDKYRFVDRKAASPSKSSVF